MEAREVIWKHHLLVYGAYDYYCARFSGASDVHQEFDVHSLPFNGYLAFARDARFLGKFCPARMCELIFVACNVDDAKVAQRIGRVSQQRDVLNKKHRLNRHEFVEALVRIAIVR